MEITIVFKYDNQDEQFKAVNYSNKIINNLMGKVDYKVSDELKDSIVIRAYSRPQGDENKEVNNYSSESKTPHRRKKKGVKSKNETTSQIRSA